MQDKLLLMIALILFSCGCASASPPEYKVRKGTQKPYKIDGKWYTPVASSYGFEETGLASWYGRDFHGKKTSNGEVYDMYAMTAAHKTLPMNTYVKVTRLDDGRETVVRINDRGPFVRERIIDLSYSAAKEIGIEDLGTTRVKIVALGSKKGDHLVKSDYRSGSFFVQVGAFTVRDNALKLKRDLTKEFGSALITNFHHEGRRFYRVRIGPLNGFAKAEKIIRLVAGRGLGAPFLVRE